MATWSLKCGVLDLRIDSARDCVHDTCMELYAALRLWRGNVPVTSLRFAQQDESTYRLVIEHADGRRWVQVLRFGSPPSPDPSMTFNVSDGWRLSEFVHSRPVRDLLVTLVVTCGMTACDVEFTVR